MATSFDLEGRLPRHDVAPGAILDFHQDWSAWLGGAPLQSMTWVVPSGLTVVTQSEEDGVMTVWLSGFVEGKTYEIQGTPATDTTPQRKTSRYFLLTCKKTGT